jgi:hypothetical protein
MCSSVLLPGVRALVVRGLVSGVEADGACREIAPTAADEAAGLQHFDELLTLRKVENGVGQV